MSLTATDAYAQPPAWTEYRLKAAFIYNFARFVTWPENTFKETDDSISLCIVSDQHNDVFFSLNNKTVRGKKLEVKECESNCFCPDSDQNDKNILFKIIPELQNKKVEDCGCEESGACHILFFNSTNRKFVRKRLESVKNQSVLTVGEMEGFIEIGGIIGFSVMKKKLRYEVNLDAARQSGLKLRSKLLKSAARVIGRKDRSEKGHRPRNVRQPRRRYRPGKGGK
ncbi:YfiR family protein [Desulfobacterales bacterium HSG2]|nr:YfiR family protein [Desulfobacterales bacterium HSG2]